MRQGLLSLLVLMSTISLYGQREVYSNRSRGADLFDAGMYSAAQKEFASELSEKQSEESAFLMVMCSIYLEQSGTKEQLSQFVKNYPNSIYDDQIALLLADLLYSKGDYEKAVEAYENVKSTAISKQKKDETSFRMGHSLFNIGDYTAASDYFKSVEDHEDYADHAKYHIAFIEYEKGSYSAAKSLFKELLSNDAYSVIIPYYILQIEFLENNHRYVVDNGVALMEAVYGNRASEIARILSESWFKLDDFSKALDYIVMYQELGGEMGRYEYYILGFCTYKMGHYEKAIPSLQAASGADDELTQNASYHLADCYLEMGDKKNSMVAFSMASDTRFNSIIAEDALFNYGKLQYELGRGVFNEAINVLQRYLKTYPESPRVDEVRGYLGSAYYNSKNYKAAYEAIKLMPNPDNNVKAAMQKISYFRALELWNGGDVELAQKLLNESLNQKYNAKYTALASFWLGEIAYKKGDYKAAIERYNTYIRLSPVTERENIMSHYSIGYSYFNQNDWKMSSRYFNQFLAKYKTRDSYRADALNRLGDSYFGDRNYKMAYDCYDEARKLNVVERFYSQYQRAIMLGLSKNVNDKIASLNTIVATGKGSYIDDALYEVSRTYLVQGRYKEAVNSFQRFIKEYPTSQEYVNALSGLGLASENLGNSTEAMKYYKMVVDKAPRSTNAKSAMLGLKGIYVGSDDVDGYFEFVTNSDVEMEIGAVEQDSLTFTAAERLYISGDAKAKGALKNYINKFENGVFVSNALYYYSSCMLRDKDTEGAIEALLTLDALYYNDYTERGVKLLAELSFDSKKYEISSKSYKRLAELSKKSDAVSKALVGYLSSVELMEDDLLYLGACDYVIDSSLATTELREKAMLAKAKLLEKSGKSGDAMVLLEKLRGDAESVYGAEATYMVVERLYAAKKYDKAEKIAIKFAESTTTHSYWLGRTFIVLGDVYIAKEDNFQARATLQSIVDGYLPVDDGVVDSAKDKIQTLK